MNTSAIVRATLPIASEITAVFTLSTGPGRIQQMIDAKHQDGSTARPLHTIMTDKNDDEDKGRPLVECAWPRCAEQSAHPFTDGWCSYTKADGLLPGLPADGFLCPIHKLAFEQLALDEQPTDSVHALGKTNDR
jgi:hypothetical protein